MCPVTVHFLISAKGWRHSCLWYAPYLWRFPSRTRLESQVTLINCLHLWHLCYGITFSDERGPWLVNLWLVTSYRGKLVVILPPLEMEGASVSAAWRPRAAMHSTWSARGMVSGSCTECVIVSKETASRVNKYGQMSLPFSLLFLNKLTDSRDKDIWTLHCQNLREMRHQQFYFNVKPLLCRTIDTGWYRHHDFCCNFTLFIHLLFTRRFAYWFILLTVTC